MVFSKSFGYALRGILYVAMVNEDKTRVQLEEIAGKLAVPRYFLGKVMKKIVKGGVLNSLKGPYGGFYVNNKTMNIPLLKLIEITGEAEAVTGGSLYRRPPVIPRYCDTRSGLCHRLALRNGRE